MTEPLYEYIKGQGWIVQNHKRFPKFVNGRKYEIEIEMRPPKAGERGYWVNKDLDIDAVAAIVHYYTSESAFGWRVHEWHNVMTEDPDMCITVRTYAIT